MKIGDKVFISPQVTHQTDWIEGVIIEIEKNPFAVLLSRQNQMAVKFFLKKKIFLNILVRKHVRNKL